MKTPMIYSTFSTLAALTATALFLSTAYPALAEGGDSQNNPDKTCKYKKKKKCSTGSSSDESTFEAPMGTDGKCPDASSFATVGDEYEYTLIGPSSRSSLSRADEKRSIKGGFGPNYVSPESIHFYGEAEDIIRDSNTNIRQIKNVDLLTDFVFTGEKTLEIRQYKVADLQAGKVQGLYVPKSGIEPLYLTRMSQSADGNTVRTDIINNEGDVPSIKTEEMTQNFDKTAQTLTLIKRYMKGQGLSEIVYKESTTKITPVFNGAPKEEKYLSEDKELGTDNVMYVVSRKAGRRAVFKEEDGFVKLYECDAVNESGTPMALISTEANYTYYTDPLEHESYGKVHTLRRNDGYWENKYYNENTNAGIEIEKTESPWLNTAAHEPGTAPQGKIRVKEEVRCSTDNGVESRTETVDGIAITKEWTEKTPLNQQMVKEVRHQPHSGGDKITTTVRYRRAKDIPSHLSGRPISIHNADGSMSLYTYSLNGQNLTVTEDTGYGGGNAVTHGTRTVSTRDKDSESLKEEVRYALENGQAHWLESKTGVNFDNKGLALKWVYNNNPEDYTEQRKDCCHITWERGRDGIETTYTYDASGRNTSATTRGITQSIEYNGSTTVQWKQMTGSSQKYLVEEICKNLAQQIIERKTPAIGDKKLKTKEERDIVSRKIITTTPQGTIKGNILFADGQIFNETKTTGLVKTFMYSSTSENGGGLIISMTDGSRSETRTLDLLNNTVSSQENNNALTRYMYDPAGRNIKTTLPDGEMEIYVYEQDTKIIGMDLNRDGILNPEQDRMSRKERIFDTSWPEEKGSWKTITSRAWRGNWEQTHVSWETEDNTLTRHQISGLNGYTLEQKPAPLDRGKNYTLATIQPEGIIQETTYTQENGYINSIEMIHKDANGQILKRENQTWDIWGNILTQTNTRTGTTTSTYDEGTGIILTKTTPDQKKTSYQHDDFGRLVKTTLSDNSEQYIAYDTENRIVRQWGSQQHPVSYEYDAYGEKTAMLTYRAVVENSASWPEGATGDRTTWTYDTATGKLLRKTYADGHGITYTYTIGGKQQTQTNARGTVSTCFYTSAGELATVQFDDNNVTSTKIFVYDQLGRITSATTEGVSSYQYIYNDWDQIIEEWVSISTLNGNLERCIARSYDSYGRTVGYKIKHGDAVEQDILYSYTPAAQLGTVMADNKEFTYEYLANAPHLVNRITGPEHTTENLYSTNGNALLKKINRWKNKNGTPIISSYSYVVNDLGQRISLTTEGEAFGTTPANWTWEYDVLGQITRANNDNYVYDQIGNRQMYRKGDNSELVYTTNSLNQYTKVGAIDVTYDADGNQLAGLVPTASLPERNTLVFAYNAENRPISVSQQDEILEEYKYDHMGRRTHKLDTVFLYDGYNVIAEYKNTNRTLLKTYARGKDMTVTIQGAGGIGGLLSITEYTRQQPLTSYACYDGNGNITQYLTGEETGKLTAHYEYDAFGNIVNKKENSDYIFNFSSCSFNKLTGLIYYNYRDYDAPNGRWLTHDPIGENGGNNLYEFVQNDAVNYIDILGNKKAPDVIKDGAETGTEKGVADTVGDHVSTLINGALGYTCNPYKDKQQKKDPEYASCKIVCESKGFWCHVSGGCADKTGYSDNQVRAIIQCSGSPHATWTFVKFDRTPTGCSAKCHPSCEEKKNSVTYMFP